VLDPIEQMGIEDKVLKDAVEQLQLLEDKLALNPGVWLSA
jgi:hypothetical protein